jgi:hypothetical protein
MRGSETGTAAKPSIPPLRLIIIKFFFGDCTEPYKGILKLEKNIVARLPFKKLLLVQFMIALPLDY